MINFLNRVPTRANRKRILLDTGEELFGTIEYADEPTENGTPINRATLMGAQGFIDSIISFDPSGDIVQTFDDGSRLLTQFASDGSISEILTDNLGNSITRKTRFESDGRIITEVTQ